MTPALTTIQAIAYASDESRDAVMRTYAAFRAAEKSYVEAFHAALTESKRRQLELMPDPPAFHSAWERAMAAFREDAALREKPVVEIGGDYCRPVHYMSDGTERIYREPREGRGRGCAEGLM